MKIPTRAAHVHSRPTRRFPWREFLKVGYPHALQVAESRWSKSRRLNRWVGIRVAYAFYRLGLSANGLSAARIMIAAVGLGMLGLVGPGAVALPAIGALLLALQVHLDFVDGVIARANMTLHPIGEVMDGAANAFARGGIIVLLGFLSGNLGWLIASALGSYVLVMLLSELNRATGSGSVGRLPLMFRLPTSVAAMVVALPVAMLTLGLFRVDIVPVARALVAAYLVVAVLSSLLVSRVPPSRDEVISE